MSEAAEPGATRKDAFRALAAAPDLRRLMLANLGSIMGKYAWWVALAVWAFGKGGPALVGALGFARVAPAIVSSLFIGRVLARRGIRRTLVETDLIRAVLLGLVGVCVLVDAAPVFVILLIAVAGAASAFFYPSQQALLPAVAETPDQVTAANVATSLIEGVGMFLGPALGAVLLVATSPEVVVLAAAGALVASAALIARIEADEPERDEVQGGLMAEAASGFRVIGADRGLSALVALITAQCVLSGALLVLIVVIALDLLAQGQAWVGILDAAVGVGGVLGGAVAATLVGRERLAGPFAGSMLLWGGPFVLVAFVAEPAVALVAMVLVGVGNAVGDVSFMTLMHRAVPEEKLGRAFGAMESLVTGGMAARRPARVRARERDQRGDGADRDRAAPARAHRCCCGRGWQRLDAAAMPAPALEALRRIPMLAILPPPAIEALARSAERVRLPVRSTVFRQGDTGDRYYVIEEGSVQVTIDGRPVRVQGAVSGFGEIALLHEVPRTATVTTLEPLTAWTLDRADFLAAVSGNPGAQAEASRRTGSLLAHARPGFAPL